MGVVRQLVNRSAGRSGFEGNTSLAPQGAMTITSFRGRPPPEPGRVPPLPTGEDATDGARPVLLAGEGATELPPPLWNGPCPAAAAEEEYGCCCRWWCPPKVERRTRAGGRGVTVSVRLLGILGKQTSASAALSSGFARSGVTSRPHWARTVLPGLL